MTEQTQDSVKLCREWQDAANRGAIERLLTLSDPHILVIGPRGGGRGHQLLRDWMQRAGLHLKTFRTFARDDTVVFAQLGIWRTPNTGEVVGEQEVASRFRVRNGVVIELARYDLLQEALRDAGLEQADERLAPRDA